MRDGGVLTGDGAEVEVVPDDLLQLVVHRVLLEAQVQVSSQVLVDDAPWREDTPEEVSVTRPEATGHNQTAGAHVWLVAREVERVGW